jgi:hypothetical protein
MQQPKETKCDVDFTLPVKMTRLGHEPIIQHGTAIRCIHDHVNLYDELNSEINRPHPFPPERRVVSGDAGVGLVFDHRYHVCPLELSRVSLSRRFVVNTTEYRLEDVYQNLWYCIMFKKGHFWARYDWIEIILQPVAVQSACGTTQRPEAW